MARQAKLMLDDWDRFTAAVERKPQKVTAVDLFAEQCLKLGLPKFEREVLFAKAAVQRLWRFDFGFRAYLVAVEIEGIVPRRIGREFVAGGRHGSVAGIIEDMDKYNTAALLGWTVLRFPQKYVKPHRAIEMTMQVLKARGWAP